MPTKQNIPDKNNFSNYYLLLKLLFLYNLKSQSDFYIIFDKIFDNQLDKYKIYVKRFKIFLKHYFYLLLFWFYKITFLNIYRNTL